MVLIFSEYKKYIAWKPQFLSCRTVYNYNYQFVKV